MSFRPSAGLTQRTIDGELVILDRASGKIHQLNPTASFVWNQIEASETVETIAAGLAEQYEVSLAAATSDVGRVVEELTKLKLLAPEGGGTDQEMEA